MPLTAAKNKATLIAAGWDAFFPLREGSATTPVDALGLYATTGARYGSLNTFTATDAPENAWTGNISSMPGGSLGADSCIDVGNCAGVGVRANTGGGFTLGWNFNASAAVGATGFACAGFMNGTNGLQFTFGTSYTTISFKIGGTNIDTIIYRPITPLYDGCDHSFDVTCDWKLGCFHIYIDGRYWASSGNTLTDAFRALTIPDFADFLLGAYMLNSNNVWSPYACKFHSFRCAARMVGADGIRIAAELASEAYTPANQFPIIYGPLAQANSAKLRTDIVQGVKRVIWTDGDSINTNSGNGVEGAPFSISGQEWRREIAMLAASGATPSGLCNVQMSLGGVTDTYGTGDVVGEAAATGQTNGIYTFAYATRFGDGQNVLQGDEYERGSTEATPERRLVDYFDRSKGYYIDLRFRKQASPTTGLTYQVIVSNSSMSQLQVGINTNANNASGASSISLRGPGNVVKVGDFIRMIGNNTLYTVTAGGTLNNSTGTAISVTPNLSAAINGSTTAVNGALSLALTTSQKVIATRTISAAELTGSPADVFVERANCAEAKNYDYVAIRWTYGATYHVPWFINFVSIANINGPEFYMHGYPGKSLGEHNADIPNKQVIMNHLKVTDIVVLDGVNPSIGKSASVYVTGDWAPYAAYMLANLATLKNVIYAGGYAKGLGADSGGKSTNVSNHRSSSYFAAIGEWFDANPTYPGFVANRRRILEQMEGWTQVTQCILGYNYAQWSPTEAVSTGWMRYTPMVGTTSVDRWFARQNTTGDAPGNKVVWAPACIYLADGDQSNAPTHPTYRGQEVQVRAALRAVLAGTGGSTPSDIAAALNASGFVLAASQPLYAPSKAGDAMTLSNTVRVKLDSNQPDYQPATVENIKGNSGGVYPVSVVNVTESGVKYIDIAFQTRQTGGYLATAVSTPIGVIRDANDVVLSNTITVTSTGLGTYRARVNATGLTTGAYHFITLEAVVGSDEYQQVTRAIAA